MLAAPESSALTAHGLPPIGARWREAATTIDYFSSTARLADGVGAWAMLAARLGDGAANRAFAERWWRGAVRGTDVLFPAGESMAAALRRLQADSAAVDWQAAVARFRSALAKTENLAAERSEVAAAVTRISDLEQACEEASGSAEAAQARLAELAAGEPVRPRGAGRRRGGSAGAARRPGGAPARPASVRHRHRRRQDGAQVAQRAVDRGGRRGAPGQELAEPGRPGDASCAPPAPRRSCGGRPRRRSSQALNASLAVAWTAVNDETAEVTRLTAEIGPLAEAVALARQRWGDHVPDGPAQAETEDAALIEWRETSAPWADEEYAASRAEVFLAALDLHKTLIAARADVFAGNLGALMDLLCADPTWRRPQAGRAGGSRTWRQRTNARNRGRTRADGSATTRAGSVASAVASVEAEATRWRLSIAPLRTPLLDAAHLRPECEMTF